MIRSTLHAILTIAVFTGLSFSASPGRTAETISKHGIIMIDIPAGSFQMGSCTATENKQNSFLGKPGCTVDTDASDSEGPLRKVTLREFQMGKTPVTLGQFKKFIADANRSDLVTNDFIKYNAYGDNAPVVWVSWIDAQAFIVWLNQTDGGGWRLPSEAEWEYACRAGGNHRYCGSDNIDDVGWYDGNSGKRLQAVGGKQANAFGLHDMTGNVWEWTQDCWHDNYLGAPTDGSARTKNCIGNWRVLRGGTYQYDARIARAHARDIDKPDERSSDDGFRLARTN